MSSQEAQSLSAELTAEIVAAFVANNSVSQEELPGLIMAVAQALAGVAGAAPKPSEPAPLVPAVPIKKSVTDDYIISLEDGRRFKSLKRYLMTRHNMTPEDYRRKWGLPVDYPMVAPNYAASRSALAKASGLGRKPAPEPEPVAPEPKRRAPRKTKEAA